MTDFLHNSIEYLKGVGPKRAELLQKELGIFTFNDLLHHFPFRYIDRSEFHRIRDVHEGIPFVQLKGKLMQVEEMGQKQRKRLVALLQDETGTIELIWFKGIKWIKPNLTVGSEVIVFGRPTRYKNKFNMAHPEVEPAQSTIKRRSVMQPVYSSTEKLSNRGLNSKGIEKIIRNLVPDLKGKVKETLPEWLIKDLNLLGRDEAYQQVHMPTGSDMAQRAQFRLKFEELFFLQLQLIMEKRISMSKTSGHNFEKVGDYFNTFYKDHIPFELTDAQKRVLKEIRKDLGSGKQMNRLLQGDVGSGKTMVALLSLLLALDNGFQGAIMAPTEILATQHYHSIREMLEGMDVTVELLTGSTKKAERKGIHERLQSGELDILVGTHALLEDEVKWKNLGLSVIDEQHRFGVAQRARMYKKNTTPPHILIMTATPIPRTLAMTFYGDLDVSVIDELPPGRKPVKTIHRFEKSRLKVFQSLQEQIALGRQAYIVYPLIEESEKMEYKDLMAGYEAITKRFPAPKYRVSIVHGRMKPEDKDYEMQQFAEGKTHIMVATTVIEVGVNVPNASVMIIENAEKFGLSQLHQLRGRVGRGADQSYCILMTDYKLTEDGRKRLETMCRTNDGFEIAEVDLQLRGPGNIMGTQQSGLIDLKIADLTKDGKIAGWARNYAIKMLEDDAMLKKPENRTTAVKLMNIMKSRPSWSRVS